MVGIDGLETKVWGLREDNIPDKAKRTPDISEKDESVVESSSDTDDEDEQSEDEESGGSNQEDDEDISGSDDDDDASPPLSRSPSPTLSPDSDSPPPPPPPKVPSKSPLPHTEDPETVRAAERLLSRTLASACAEDDGQGLASEMGTPNSYQCHRRLSDCMVAPTQIHVLLRAPRRFDHPSWIPRQNLCVSMDSYLAEFLVESGQTPASCDTPTKKRTKARKAQGVWVKSHGNSARIEDSEEDLAEADELIWWSWDGKLVGFADW